MNHAADRILRIKATLRHVTPAVWRRLEVPADITLDRLHDALQVAMDWYDVHLHEFRLGAIAYGRPGPDDPAEVRDEAGVRLRALAGTGDTLLYEYDFGDGWQLDLEVEGEAPAEPGARYPRCTAGARAAPPEDCGGVPGYENLLAVLADPRHPEHAEMLEWLGAPFDPEACDLEAINAAYAIVDEPLAADDSGLPGGEWPDDADPGAAPEFTAAQAEVLRAFLAAPARPAETMRYETLAGFLFVLAGSPEPVLPSEWLPLAFGGDARGRGFDPGFRDRAEAERIVGALMALYNRMAHGVRTGDIALPPGIEPRSPPIANFDDDAPLALWARGVAEGYGYLEELWDAYVPESLDEELGSCMIVLSYFASRDLAAAYGREFEGRTVALEERAQTMLDLVPDALASFASIAAAIQTAVDEDRARRSPVRSDKIGRNAPCPCGSGKKYKKCCGADR